MEKTQTQTLVRPIDSLDLFVAASLVGVLAAHEEEPDMAYVCRYAVDMGLKVAVEMKKQHRSRRAKKPKA